MVSGPWLPVMSVLALILGGCLVFFPRRAFEIQKKFYEQINWRIEPISLRKEIRNTRLMGGFLILFVVGVLFYIYVWS